MRITGGNAKGRQVGQKKAFSKSAGGYDLRPTPAKVRKAIFDILGPRTEGARFLDLYAGTGAVGIEALSRGAAHVVFVEEDDKRTALVSKYLASFGLDRSARTISSKTERFLSTIHNEGFDIIFMDPPYGLDEWARMFGLLCEKGVVADRGVVIAEHSSRNAMPEEIACLRLKKQYRYGDTSLSLYTKTDFTEEQS